MAAKVTSAKDKLPNDTYHIMVVNMGDPEQREAMCDLYNRLARDEIIISNRRDHVDQDDQLVAWIEYWETEPHRDVSDPDV